MIGWLMRQMPPGSFVWLVLHELRLSSRGKATKRRFSITGVLGWIIFAIWTGLGVLAALVLAHVPIEPNNAMRVGVLAVSIAAFTFMTTQALLASQRTLYETADLDLLLSSPMRPRTVISAKLVGIVTAVVGFFALLLLPIAVPIAAIGHPRLFGIVGLIAALATVAACLGLALTLLIARIAGPRAARTVGQIFAALAGGLLFLVGQLSNIGREQGKSAFDRIYDWLNAHGYGSRGWSAFLSEAGFGDPLALAVLLGFAALLFAATAIAMNSLFVSAYRAGGMRLSRTRRARGGIAKHFRPGMFATVFAKEWKLLARDPALVFQVVLRLIYLVPVFFIGFRNPLVMAPGMALMSVVIAGQLVGSLAWLTVSAEDTPDLLKVAPIDKTAVDRAKMAAAVAMAMPMIVILPIVIALQTPVGALVTLAMTLFGGWLTGLLEVRFGKPAPRSSFRGRRSGGSLVRTLLQFAMMMVLGVIAAGTVFLLTDGFSRIGLPQGGPIPGVSIPHR